MTVKATASARNVSGSISARNVAGALSLVPDTPYAHPTGSGTDSVATPASSGGGFCLYGQGSAALGAPMSSGEGWSDQLAMLRSVIADASLPGIYSATGVRLNGGGGVGALDDDRCSTTTGRAAFPGVSGQSFNFGNYLGLNGVAKATVIAWFTPYKVTAFGALFARFTAVTANQQLFFGINSSGQPHVEISTGAAVATANGSTVLAPGTTYKLAMVFDGSQATNATRLKLTLGSRQADGSYSADTAETPTYTGTVPAAMVTAATANATSGDTANTGNAFLGCIDEVRVWAGTALSSAQIAAETLTANAVAPPLRWQFNGDATNIGTTAGFNGTAASGIAYSSDDLRWGPTWIFSATACPTLATNAAGFKVLRFDGVNDSSVDNPGLHAVFKSAGAGFLSVAAATTAAATVGGALINISVSTATNTRARLSRDVVAGQVTAGALHADGDATVTISGGVSDATLRGDLGVFDWAGGTVALYQAGVAKGSANLAASGNTDNTASKFAVIGSDGAGGIPFHGDLSALVIGSIVPSAAQIAAIHLYNQSKGAAA